TWASQLAFELRASFAQQSSEQRWADKDYKKSHLGTRWKANPFGGASHAKGIVVEKIGVEAKQPTQCHRKCVRVQLIKNGKKITAFVPNDGCLNFIEENDEMLGGFGRGGHAVLGDIPDVSDSKSSKVANRVVVGAVQRQEGGAAEELKQIEKREHCKFLYCNLFSV
uniref:Small ribosomal subunit protein uS12 n=1 Tax=Macrostomum lignano TaxID=282301 RepID=A0A1I8FCX9_9PLAT